MTTIDENADIQTMYRSDIEDMPTYEEVIYWRDHLLGE